MTFTALLSPFAPELILLGGACLLLLIGAVRGLGGPVLVSPVAFLIVAVALYASWVQGVPAMDAAPLGLWVTSLSFYTRCIALSIGLLLILANWRVSESSERGEFMAIVRKRVAYFMRPIYWPQASCNRLVISSLTML